MSKRKSAMAGTSRRSTAAYLRQSPQSAMIDAAWFEKNRNRRFRVRKATPAELDMLQRLEPQHARDERTVLVAFLALGGSAIYYTRGLVNDYCGLDTMGDELARALFALFKGWDVAATTQEIEERILDVPITLAATTIADFNAVLAHAPGRLIER